MNAFAKQMLLGTVAFGSAMALMAVALRAIYYHHRSCDEAMVSAAENPDKRWKAVVMERRCPDESLSYMHVNLIATGDPLPVNYSFGPSQRGEVFVVQEETQDMNPALAWRSPNRRTNPTLEWTSPDRLMIHCPRCRAALIRRRDERWGPVTITYEVGQQ